MSIWVSSDTLSRLKGIETILDFDNFGLAVCGSDTLSRLKGIETKNTGQVHPPAARSDTLSRLKGIETLNAFVIFLSLINSSDTLSRLKGIETRVWVDGFENVFLFRYAFPFEGN